MSLTSDLEGIPIIGAAGEGYREIGEAIHKGTVKNQYVTKPKTGSLGKAEQAIQKASEKYKINPAYLWGVYGVETDHGANIKTSSTGAKGPFQFEPETAKAYGYPTGVNENGVTNWAAFGQQAEAAARYLSSLGLSKNPSKALEAYSGHTPGYTEKVVESAKSWGKIGTTEAENKAEAEKTENTPVEGLWPKFGELGVNLILVLVGAALLVYGVMVMVRPRKPAPVRSGRPSYMQLPVT